MPASSPSGSTDRPMPAPRWTRTDISVSAVVALFGGFLLFLFGSAFADGEVRRKQAPLRSLIGDEAYNALSAGAASPQHYLGRERRAPTVRLAASDGTMWSLQDQRGKVVVLNFWSVTCRACLEEMPSLISLARILRGRDDIELVAVSVDRDWDTVRTVIPEGSGLKVVLDPGREVVQGRFGTRLFPETWVVDPEGVIRLRVDGARDWSSPVALEVFESFR